MNIRHIPAMAAGVAIIAFTACSDSTSANSTLVGDAVVTADVAASSGDAIATSVAAMTLNESTGGLPSLSAVVAESAPVVEGARTRTCYDANGTVVNNCAPLASVRKIVSHVVFSGSRSGSNGTTGGETATWSGAVHRTSNDTLVRVFNTAQPPVETSRIHSDLTVGHDTTTFSQGTTTRVASETSSDTVKAVTFNLPRSSNPYPASGKIVRVVSVRVVGTRENKTETRETSRKVEVTFPPDAQGNVALKVNDKSCTLNLVTHVVTNCQ